MTAILLGALLFAALATAVECYFVIGRAQRLMTYAEQLIAAVSSLLALAPTKSAPPTEAPKDVRPRAWWKRLRALDDVPEAPDAAEAPDTPATVPMAQAVDAWQQAEIPPRLDDVDETLARFTYATGYMRGRQDAQAHPPEPAVPLDDGGSDD